MDAEDIWWGCAVIKPMLAEAFVYDTMWPRTGCTKTTNSRLKQWETHQQTAVLGWYSPSSRRAKTLNRTFWITHAVRCTGSHIPQRRKSNSTLELC